MKPPVFIVGCPRSGTSFLYHLLLSAGGFAEFHTQMNVYDVLEPIYGDLGVRKNKEAAMREWLQSKAFRVPPPTTWIVRIRVPRIDSIFSIVQRYFNARLSRAQRTNAPSSAGTGWPVRLQ